MKKGMEIQSMLKQINDDVNNKRDYLVDLNGIKVSTSENVYPTMSVDHLTTGEYQLTDNSLSHLCNRLEMGTRYISKCLPVSQELVAHNINFWINNNKTKNL